MQKTLIFLLLLHLVLSQTIHLGVLIHSFSPSESPDGTKLKTAMEIARDYVQNHTTLLGPFTLYLNITTSESSPTKAVEMANSLFESGAVGLIGCYSSSESIPVSQQVANQFMKPMISYSSTSSVLGDKTTHPYFLRVIPSDKVQAEVLVDLCYMYQWYRVGVIASEDAYGLNGAEDMKIIGEQKGISIISASFLPGGDPTSALQQLMGSGIKVFVIFASSQVDMKDLLMKAQSLGLLEEGNVWIGSEVLASVARQTSDSELKSLLQGFLIAEAGTHAWLKREYFLKEWALRVEGKPYYDIETIDSLDQYFPYAYDTVLAFAEAFSYMIKEDEDINNGKLLLEALRKVDFLGTTGRIKFKPNGDIFGAVYNIINVVGTQFNRIASWGAASGLQRSGDVVFPKNPEYIPENPSGIILNATIVAHNQWFSIPFFNTPPSSRHSYAIAVREDELLIFGGTDNRNIFNDLWKFDFKTQYWSQLFPLGSKPHSRYECTGGIANGYFLLFGGFDGSAFYNDLWRYDFENHQWKELETHNGPAPRRKARSVVYNNKFIIFGGQSLRSKLNDIWEFDLNTGTWNEIIPATEMRPSPVCSHNLVLKDDNMITWGGETDDFPEGAEDLWTFSFITKTWTKLNQGGQIPPTRYISGSAIVGQEMFVIAGWTDEEDDSLNDMYALNITNLLEPDATLQWRQVFTRSTMPDTHSARDSFSAVSYDTNLVWFGGWGETDFFNDLYRYQPQTNQFTAVYSKKATPVGLKYHTSSLIGDNLLVFGGQTTDQSTTNELYKFNIETQSWERIDTAISPPKRKFHASVTVGDLMYMYGGETESENYYGDLWVYSLVLNEWRELIPSGILPPPRSGHVMEANSSHIIIFGGQSKSNIYTDVYALEMVTLSWVSVPTFDTPRHTTKCRSLMNGDRYLLIAGCVDGGDTPMNSIYQLDLHTGYWSEYVQLPLQFPVARPSFTRVANNTYLLFGGSNYGELSNELWMVKDKQVFAVDQSVSEMMPFPREGHTANYYGSKMIIFGGLGTFPDGTYALRDSVYPDLWEWRIGPICSSIAQQSSCITCSEGTYEYNGICIPCPLGTYNDIRGAQSCKPCNMGFYGPFSGAAFPSLCLPCPHGMFNNETGQSQCKKCSPGKTCPLGATREYDEHVFNSTLGTPITVQPQPIEHRDRLTNLVMIIAFSTAALLATVICGLIIVLWAAGVVKTRWITIGDVLFSARHNTTGVMKIEKTEIGSIFSIIAILLVLALFVYMLVPWLSNNDVETRSLIPNISKKFAVDGEFTIFQTIEGYPGKCLLDETQNTSTFTNCSSLITVKTTGIAKQYEEYLCQQHTGELSERKCTVYYQCKKCDVLGADAMIQFLFLEPNTYCSAYEYTFRSSTGYDEQDSIIQQRITSDEEMYFRGTNEPTVVDVNVIQTTVTSTKQNTTTVGYHLDYRRVHKGTQVDYRTFGHYNGLRFEFRIEETLYTLEVIISEKKTVVGFFSELLAAISGLIAGIAVLMRITERTYWFIKAKAKQYKNYKLKKEVEKRATKSVDEKKTDVELKDVNSPSQEGKEVS